MQISVGIDIAKEIHWVTAIDAGGVVQVDRKLLNTPAGIATLVDELTCACSKVETAEQVAFIALPPYRRGHDRSSVRCRFPAFVPGAKPRLVGT